jgi:serine/threonine-protein kinase
MTIKCSHCRHLNRDSARFCGLCGVPLIQAGFFQTGLLSPNTLLAGRYLVLRKIAQGGFGAVYQASDRRLPGKLWAVKEMSDAVITDPAERQRAISAFLQEAQILVSLDHSNIPKVIDSFDQAGKHYLVMEYVDGNTLETLLTARGHPFTEAEVRSWLDQLCSALAYLHSRHPPVIFRDLKPENIMLDRSSQIKLIDFGIARFFKPGKAKDTALLGTLGYAPPEQYGQGQTDARSDIYALGATLHRLLTCHDPTSTPFNLPPVRSLNSGISQTIERMINRALQPDPRNRWRSVDEIRATLWSDPLWQSARPDRLDAATQRGPIQLTQPRPPSRPTTRLLLAVAEMSNRQLAIAVGILVILVALGIWVLAPIIARDFPVIAYNMPGFVIIGPAAYAAARRHGAAIVTHVPITLVGWLTWYTRIGYVPNSYWPLVIGVIISGLVLEVGLYCLPKVRGKAGDEAWKREIAWFALLGVAAAISFYVFSGDTAFSMRLGMWIGAAVLGALGWFLGDLVQQWLFLRQTGMRRATRV